MLTLWYGLNLFTGNYPIIQNEEKAKQVNDFVLKVVNDICPTTFRCFESKFFQQCANRSTVYGSTLQDVIFPNLKNPPCEIGIYAPDPDAYDVFNEFFDRTISILHDCYHFTAKTPPTYYGDPKKFLDIDPLKTYILSTQIRCIRNLNGYAYTPKLTVEQLLQIEKTIKLALFQISSFDTGYYYSLDNLVPEKEATLRGFNFLFTNCDSILRNANAYNAWPKGRGVWYNSSKTILIWVNEVDHLRMMAMQKGANFPKIYGDYIKYLTFLENKLEFHIHSKLGHLSFSPLNLGTAMKVSCKMYLPNFNSRQEYMGLMRKTCQIHGMMYAVDECGEPGTFLLWNRKCLGITEFETMLKMQEGLCDLIRIEKNIPEGINAVSECDLELME